LTFRRSLSVTALSRRQAYVRRECAPSHRERSQEEQTKLYAGFHRIILKETGIDATDAQVMQLLARMFQLNASMKFVLFDDVIETLKTLKAQGLKLGLLTNLQTEVNTMCRELGISEYLDFTVTSAEVGADKPQPPIS